MQGVAFEGRPSAQNINMLIRHTPSYTAETHRMSGRAATPPSECESEDVKASTGNGSHATHRTVTDLDLVSSLLH